MSSINIEQPIPVAPPAGKESRTAHNLTGGPIDFDLHGLVGVRLIGAGPRETAAVGRQLGLLPTSNLQRQPEITVRFGPALRSRGSLRLLGENDAAYSEDAFLVLHSRHKARTRTQIPMDRIGGSCEILCERGTPAVPLLVPIINLTLLAKGVAPLHASAFLHEGLSVLAAGWSKGGKTEALLAFMAQGAQYLGDDWVYLTPSGRSIFGIPEPVRLLDWHLSQLPEFRRHVGGWAKLRLRALRTLHATGQLAAGGTGQKMRISRLAAQAISLLERQMHVTVSPDRLFGNRFAPQPARLDRVLLMVSHASPEILVQPIAAAEVARRMVHSNQHESLRFMAYYHKFRFAFPDRCNPLIEQAEALQRSLLEQALGDKPAFVVYHPYPVRISELFDAIWPRLK